MEKLIIISLLKAADELVIPKEKMNRLRERILNLYAKSGKFGLQGKNDKRSF